MAGRLSGKVGIVTGAGRGIGRSIAEAYAAEGMHVVVTASSEVREIEEVAARASGRAVHADVTREKDVQRVIDEALKHFGRIDVLVNNAARGMKYVNEEFLTNPQPFWRCAIDAWRLVIDTNVNGVFLMSRAIVPPMLEQGAGRIINISINHETQHLRQDYGASYR